MVANLRAENIDGFLGPDPFNQRAVYDGVGFIHVLTRELWDGHPCCALAVPRRMVTEAPGTYQALLRSVIEASAHANRAENRKEIAGVIAGQNYLNQPVTVVEQALTGTYADGLGAVKREPARVSFEPFPYQSMALWIMTQMKRWGQVQGRPAAGATWRSRSISRPTPAPRCGTLGLTPPASAYKPHTIMGKTFDPPIPTATLASFPSYGGLMALRLRSMLLLLLILAVFLGAWQIAATPSRRQWPGARPRIREAARRIGAAGPANARCRARPTSPPAPGTICGTRSTCAAPTTRGSASSSAGRCCGC